MNLISLNTNRLKAPRTKVQAFWMNFTEVILPRPHTPCPQAQSIPNSMETVAKVHRTRNLHPPKIQFIFPSQSHSPWPRIYYTAPVLKLTTHFLLFGYVLQFLERKWTVHMSVFQSPTYNNRVYSDLGTWLHTPLVSTEKTGPFFFFFCTHTRFRRQDHAQELDTLHLLFPLNVNQASTEQNTVPVPHQYIHYNRFLKPAELLASYFQTDRGRVVPRSNFNGRRFKSIFPVSLWFWHPTSVET